MELLNVRMSEGREFQCFGAHEVKERERRLFKKIKRERDRQTDRQTERDRDRETERQRETDRDSRGGQTETETHRETEIETDTDRARQTDRDRDRQTKTDRQTDRHSETETDRQTKSEALERRVKGSCVNAHGDELPAWLLGSWLRARINRPGVGVT